MWQLTVQMCELLEGIRCADSLAMVCAWSLGERQVVNGESVNGNSSSSLEFRNSPKL